MKKLLSAAALSLLTAASAMAAQNQFSAQIVNTSNKPLCVAYRSCENPFTNHCPRTHHYVFVPANNVSKLITGQKPNYIFAYKYAQAVNVTNASQCRDQMPNQHYTDPKHAAINHTGNIQLPQ